MFGRFVFIFIFIFGVLSVAEAAAAPSLQDLDVAPAEGAPEERFHPGAFAFDLGGAVRSGDEDSRGDWLVGLQYRHRSPWAGHWEFGLDVLGDFLGAVHGGYRLIFDRDRQVRPQLKLALASVAEKDEGLDGILQTSNVRVRAGFALERDFNEILFFRIEGEGEFGGDRNAEAHLRFGLVWSLKEGVWKRPVKPPSPPEPLPNNRES